MDQYILKTKTYLRAFIKTIVYKQYIGFKKFSCLVFSFLHTFLTLTDLTIHFQFVSLTVHHKPTEANISSMSFWMFWLLSEFPSHRLLFFCLSLKRPDKDDRFLFFCLFPFFTLSLARSAKYLFWLLTECRFVERLFQRVRTGERGLFGPRL